MYKKIFKISVVENFKINDEYGYENEFIKSYKDYIRIFRKINNYLNQKNIEWWPVEGTLIGLLRMGNVFGNIGKKVVISDSDIDIFVRCDTEEEWEKFKKDVNNYLLKDTLFTECKNGIDKLVIFNKKNNKYVCKTERYISQDCDICDDDIHIDFHRYIVDESNNLVYMNEMCKDGKSCNNKYPFQKWNGYVNYKGFIVDSNKNFLKTKFLDMDLNCPYKYIELLSNWNDNEYGNGSDIHIPRGNCIYDKEIKEISNNNNFTKSELKMICEKSKFLHNNGYSSFFSKWNGDCN